MKKLTKEWHDYCLGRANYDTLHFASLLRGELSAEQLQNLFQYFPHTEALTENVQQVLEHGYFDEERPHLIPLRENRGSPSELKQFTKAHVLDLSTVLKTFRESELLDTLQSLPVSFIEDYGIFSEASEVDSFNVEVLDNLSDYFIEAYRPDEAKTYALFEALYGLAGDYYLAWYMGAPLIAIDFSFNNYFQIWRLCGEIILTYDAALVTHLLLFDDK